MGVDPVNDAFWRAMHRAGERMVKQMNETVTRMIDDYDNKEIDMDMRERLERRIEDAERKLETLDRYEELVDADEFTVITFGKRFRDEVKVWTYAGVKVGATWYLTGSGRYPCAYTETELLEFLSSGVNEVWIATEFEEV